MNDEPCRYEAGLIKATFAGSVNGELARHATSCVQCSQLLELMQVFGEDSEALGATAKLPDPSAIYQRATLSSRSRATDRALRPIVWVERAAIGLVGASAAVAVISISPGNTTYTASLIALAALPLLFLISWTIWAEE